MSATLATVHCASSLAGIVSATTAAKCRTADAAIEYCQQLQDLAVIPLFLFPFLPGCFLCATGKKCTELSVNKKIAVVIRGA